MMYILIEIFIIGLRIIYFFMKLLLPTKNKITFISRQSNNINIDFKLMINDINERYKDYNVVVLTKKIEKGFFNKIKYIFHIFKQMYHISTSKLIILDSYCIPISVLNHKKNLKIIQIWHALGAFKKFGLSIQSKKEGSNKKLIEIMKMHDNYDYIFSSSPKCAKKFAEAFGYDIDKILTYPLPRLDLLNIEKNLNENKNKILKQYPKLKKKINIVYAPTFRIKNNSIDRKKDNSTKSLIKLIDEIDFKKYNLIIKCHPLSKLEIDDKRVIVDNKFETIDWLGMADYIITDYSAIMYETAFLEKPIFFYCYDIEKYTKNRGFYISLKRDLPGIVSSDANKIISSIEKNKFNLNKIRKFKNDNIVECKNSYTKDINDFVINLINK